MLDEKQGRAQQTGLQGRLGPIKKDSFFHGKNLGNKNDQKTVWRIRDVGMSPDGRKYHSLGEK
jgi:hypothetical protein